MRTQKARRRRRPASQRRTCGDSGI